MADPNFVAAETALALVSAGDRVFVHTGAAAPGLLMAALADRARVVEGIEVTHLHTEGPVPVSRG